MKSIVAVLERDTDSIPRIKYQVGDKQWYSYPYINEETGSICLSLIPTFIPDFSNLENSETFDYLYSKN